ncbi:MAG: LL-diaminopimelate aminotransferase [Alphaproteobacteria bacterium]|nr:MAG: LL-diaminopimelate aminotransferase [Alphaproteobacteria bacterium]
MRADFHRILRLPPYIFEEVNRLKAAARAQGHDIIDFGMGNPDMPTPEHITAKLIETARNPRTNRYSTSRGIPGLRRAVAAFYDRRFGVKIDPDRETIVTLGSKEGFANLAQAITAPGDVVLVPSPSYPIHAYGFIIAGAVIQHLPALDPDAFLAHMVETAKQCDPAPSVIVLNYPSNPTASVVDLAFYREVLRFAERYDLIVISDLAYCEIYFDGNPPPSLLQLPGAKNRAVEFTSLSKTYAMPGWRIGFAVGNEQLIAALARVKSYLDYGAYTPIQVAATAALNGPQDCVDEIRNIYKSRRDCLVESMELAGWTIPSPSASMFAWAPLPKEFEQVGSLEFSKLLIQHAKVAVSPGIGFGESGEGYVRIALVENEQRIRQAARNVRRFLNNADQIINAQTNKQAAVS